VNPWEELGTTPEAYLAQVIENVITDLKEMEKSEVQIANPAASEIRGQLELADKIIRRITSVTPYRCPYCNELGGH
jgi:hypothetical protein